MSDTPDTPTNDDDTSDLKSRIDTLAAEIVAARSEVAGGKAVDLSNFLPKVTAFYSSVSTNPPPDTDAPDDPGLDRSVVERPQRTEPGTGRIANPP